MKQAAKVALLLALVLAGAALAYAGSRPEGYQGVEAVVANPAAFAGHDVELKATIVEGSVNRTGDPITFLVADGNAQLLVHWDPATPLPDQEAGGTIEGKNVVVTGFVVTDPSGTHLVARDLKVGCASKYRAAS
jgi:cytochrome c-type biogenesis protein CcmE